jgi:hypothetical protein
MNYGTFFNKNYGMFLIGSSLNDSSMTGQVAYKVWFVSFHILPLAVLMIQLLFNITFYYQSLFI